MFLFLRLDFHATIARAAKATQYGCLFLFFWCVAWTVMRELGTWNACVWYSNRGALTKKTSMLRMRDCSWWRMWWQHVHVNELFVCVTTVPNHMLTCCCMVVAHVYTIFPFICHVIYISFIHHLYIIYTTFIHHLNIIFTTFIHW